MFMISKASQKKEWIGYSSCSVLIALKKAQGNIVNDDSISGLRASTLKFVSVTDENLAVDRNFETSKISLSALRSKYNKNKLS